jgi:ribosomal protein S12 methylthiotransferase
MSDNRLAPSSVPKVGMISLGCAKNLVDAEIMLGSVLQSGMQITANADDADVLVVNTCAFIDSAKEESIDAILEAHQQRGLGKKPGQKLIVSGCMSQRFSRELREALPEVDAFVGLDQVNELGPIVERVLKTENDRGHSFVTERPTYIPNYDTPRFRLTPAHTAYLKIAEGCNHPCSFCVIPQMRGRHRSRQPASVLSEIRALVAEGVKEINLISQDTTYYGMDLWTEKAGPRQPVDSSRGLTLSALLREIQKIEGEFWVRLLYTHPAHWSEELIETIAECDKVARYIDMPLQHIEEGMLARMRRETSRAHIENSLGGCAWEFPEWRCGPRSLSVSPARAKRRSRRFWSSSNGRASSGSVFSNTLKRKAQGPRKCRTRFQRRSRTSAIGAR